MRLPVAVGAKTICRTQLAPTASVPVQVVELIVKSPVMAGVVKRTGALPLLVTVIVCAADGVPTCCVAKVSALAESVMAGWREC